MIVCYTKIALQACFFFKFQSRLLHYIIMNKLCFNFANPMYLSCWVYDYPFHCNKTSLKIWCSLWVSTHPNCIFHFLSISTFLKGFKKLNKYCKALMQNYLRIFSFQQMWFRIVEATLSGELGIWTNSTWNFPQRYLLHLAHEST